MIDSLLRQLQDRLALSFTGFRVSVESLAKIVLLLLEIYAVYWVLTEFSWQPVLPVYQWY
jgi:hypothetical protein